MIEIQRKKSKEKYVILFFLILIFCTTFFIMYKYHVEGEKNLPFNITKLLVISSAKTENIELNENIYEANVIQKNDLYIAIEKNKEYAKEDAIKKIIINNFKIVENSEKGTVKIYRPALGKNNYEYTENYEIKDAIEYIGAKETNLKTENMTISNQGGLIELSVNLNNLGKITYDEDDNILADGSLLNRLQITSEEIRKTITFDIYIELTGGNTFKTTIFLEIPTGDIVNDGVNTNEIDVSKLVFKRV